MSENKGLYDLLVSSVRFALGLEKNTVQIPSAHRDALLRLARRQALLPLLSECFALEASDVEKLEIRNQQFLSVYRHEQYEHMLLALSNLFEAENIAFVPLKGSITCRYYPEPWMRTRSDIDVLVLQTDLNRAADLLVEKAGYRIESKNYHDITLQAKNGLFIELHFSLLEKEEGMDRVLQRAWNYTSPKEECSCHRVMSDAFFMFHQLAHTAYHFANGGCGVRFVIDLWLLSNNLSPDRSELEELLTESGLSEFYKQLHKLMQYWFAGGECDDLLLQMEAYLIEGTVFGTQKNRVAIQQSRSGGRIGFLFSRLFWSYDDLRQMYPALENKKFLLPYYQICRWCRIFNKKKMKNAVEQMNINSTVDKDEADKLREFITRVGL